QKNTENQLKAELEALEARRARILEELGISAGYHPFYCGDFVHLDDPEAFNKRFDELLKEYETYRQTYFAVEAEYVRSFGKNKYSGYESFKSARSRRLNSDYKEG